MNGSQGFSGIVGSAIFQDWNVGFLRIWNCRFLRIGILGFSKGFWIVGFSKVSDRDFSGFWIRTFLGFWICIFQGLDCSRLLIQRCKIPGEMGNFFD